MNTLRKKIEEELHELDASSLVAVYEYLRAIKAVRPEAGEVSGARAPSIEEVREKTSRSTSDWGEAVCSDRDERV